jgi:K+-sensing histidine kinase KdpD
MFCIPVLNIGNPHQVLFVINFYTRLPIAEVLSDDDLRKLGRPAERLAIILESNLRERTIRVSNDLARALAKSKSKLTTETAYNTLAETVLRRLKADRVCVYLHSKNKLKKQTSTGIAHVSSTDEISQQVQEAFRTNRESIEARKEDGIGVVNSLVVPLVDVRGTCSGVVESIIAESNRDGDWTRTHTYDDVALIEAMAQTFAPTLETLSADERRDESLSTLAHELRVPVTAFRAVCERLESECTINDFQFRYRYFSELTTYTEIMQRLMKKLTIVRTGIVDVQRKYVNLVSDIVNPTVRFMRPVLTKHKFRKFQLTHSGFDHIPNVSLDTALITQVLFNVIENAIKYFPKDWPKADFECNVKGLFTNDTLIIYFEDNGRGIADKDRERIFDYGERGPEEETCGIEGTGFGLYYCREIAKSHGGSFDLRRPRDRTIFRLVIPCPRFR